LFVTFVLWFGLYSAAWKWPRNPCRPHIHLHILLLPHSKDEQAMSGSLPVLSLSLSLPLSRTVPWSVSISHWLYSRVFVAFSRGWVTWQWSFLCCLALCSDKILPVHKQHAVRMYEEVQVRSVCSQPRLLTKVRPRPLRYRNRLCYTLDRKMGGF